MHLKHIIVSIVILMLLVASFTGAYMLYTHKPQAVESFESHSDYDPILKLRDIDVYLINMKRNNDRLRHFVRMYAKSDLRRKKFFRLEAVDGKSVDLEHIVTAKALNEILSSEKHGYRTMHYQLTRGAVGCYLSHLSIYNLMQDESRSDVALIFEDDARFGPKILEQINHALAKVPFDWDMFNLSCFCIKCDKYPEYTDVRQFFWMHAYLIKRSAASKILDYAVKTGIDKQIDSAIGVMIQMGELKVYCAKTSIVSQSNFKTTIQMPLKTLTGVNPYSLES